MLLIGNLMNWGLGENKGSIWIWFWLWIIMCRSWKLIIVWLDWIIRNLNACWTCNCCDWIGSWFKGWVYYNFWQVQGNWKFSYSDAPRSGIKCAARWYGVASSGLLCLVEKFRFVITWDGFWVRDWASLYDL